MNSFDTQLQCEDWFLSDDEINMLLATEPSDKDLAKIQERERKVRNRKPKFKIEEVER